MSAGSCGDDRRHEVATDEERQDDEPDRTAGFDGVASTTLAG
jgi:hypothetical protein